MAVLFLVDLVSIAATVVIAIAAIVVHFLYDHL